MLTSSQRAKLRGLAQKLDPIYQIGKNGISDNLASDIGDALELHELVKVSVLRNAGIAAKDALSLICEANRFVLYRRSSRDDVEHIVL